MPCCVYIENALGIRANQAVKHTDIPAQHAGIKKPVKGRNVQTYAPDLPVAKNEKWYFMLCDPNSNAVWAYQITTLAEAEAEGIELQQQQHGSSSTSKARLLDNGKTTDSSGGLCVYLYTYGMQHALH